MAVSRLQSFERALILCPHTDDEFGCAGTIVRLNEAGCAVHYVAFSRCEESVPAGFPRDVLETECRACTRSLGIDPARVRIEGFPVRHFPEHRQAILELLVSLRREIEPDLVLLPSRSDTHQDHTTIAEEGFRAFKHASMLGYELPQNLVSFAHTAFVRLTAEQLEKKIHSLRNYVSQEIREYAREPFIRGLATVRGVQCNAAFAEAFEVIRMIV